MMMYSHTLNQVTMCDSYDHLWLELSCVTWFTVCDYIIMSHRYDQVSHVLLSCVTRMIINEVTHVKPSRA
jgi:aminopeptidase N